MNKVALITGCTGQDGALLSKFLLEKDYKVIGMARRTSSPTDWRLKELNIINHPNFIVVSGDLTDQASLDRIISAHCPSEIYNLAAQSFVGLSWDLAESTIDITGLGAVRLFESVRKNKNSWFSPKIYQASSSEMFGGASRIELLNEESKFEPRSPYGAAKILAHNMAKVYRESYDMFISCGILFNHESEYRGLQFVTRKVTHGLANVLFGKQEFVQLGNLDACRDWGYAQDFVQAMWQMLQQDSPDDFVIATGKAHSIRDLVELAIRYAGLGDKLDIDKFVKINSLDKRPADVGYLLGDASKAKNLLGWSPVVNFNQMIKRMVEKDIERVKNNGKVFG